MEIVFSEYLQVTDPSSVGEVRRGALMAAHRLGFDDTRSGEFALLATEASRNVLVHGGGGQVLLVGFRERDAPLGRILAMDKGPGIADLARAMSDGYSTGGTMGGGMGAMKRIATVLEIYSNRDGTLVLLQIGKSAPDTQPLQIAGMAVPYPGERVCGDAWAYHQSPERMLILIADGLGHGWDAHEAASEAVTVFRKRADLRPAGVLEYLHEALRKTRGAVAALAEIRPLDRKLTYAGIGNISAVVSSGGTTRSLVSHNGTLGLAMSRTQEFTSDWAADAVLVMHSDGLQARWDLSAYPGLLSRHPALIGGALLRDFRRQRDDASVVVVKNA
jgi:anti-sigma regulatory factor (Ser/Thr protein kinase)